MRDSYIYYAMPNSVFVVWPQTETDRPPDMASHYEPIILDEWLYGCRRVTWTQWSWWHSALNRIVDHHEGLNCFVESLPTWLGRLGRG